jgi:hypothetical protein
LRPAPAPSSLACTPALSHCTRRSAPAAWL